MGGIKGSWKDGGLGVDAMVIEGLGVVAGGLFSAERRCG